jgi:hypothetical protein
MSPMPHHELLGTPSSDCWAFSARIAPR